MANVAEKTTKAKVIVRQQERFPAMDACRAIGSIAVVWIHTPQSAEMVPSVALGRFAVPFFLGASVFLLLRSVARNCSRPAETESRPKMTLAAFVRTRVQRLLLPFAAWSLVYLALKLAKKVIAPNQPNDFPGIEAVFLGTAYHLWFLPYLWLVSLLTFVVGRWAFQTGATKNVGYGALIAGIVMAAVACPTFAIDELSFMWLATPGVFFAISLSLWFLASPTWFERNRLVVQLVSVAVLVASTAWLWSASRNAGVEAAAGISVLLLSITLGRMAWLTWIGRLAPLSYGIYLSHLLVLKIGESVLAKLHWEPSAFRDVGMFTVALFVSVSLSYLLSRSRYTRWLLG